MNVMRILSIGIVAALLALCVAIGLNQATAFQRGPPGAPDGVEVLTRGPVHEAFAETVTFDPEPGLVAPKAPPAPIEEAPPEQRPEGANVAWISGYWAWDDERTDYLWVSGIWRSLPPGRQWVSGYWGRSAGGAQWTSGYWADAKASEVEYLPEPPATVEVGPNVAAPSPDHRWLPGSWLWQQNRYAWRPGYWAAGQSDWDWVPAHYVWTPRGYVFVDGYYDHSVARRGVLYAPVYFNSGIYTQRGFSYSPSVAINPAVFASHLFLRTGYGHYYYGDFYAATYATAGYSPWFSYNSSRYGYDPFYAQQRWVHRQDRGWEQNIQADFQNRRDNASARPPRTWTDQARIATAGAPNRQNVVMAASLAELAKNQEHPLKLKSLDTAERQQLAQHQQAVRQLREQREKLEDAAADAAAAKSKSPREFQPTRVKLPPSPIVSLPADRLDKDHVPPKLDEAPPPDPKIAPTARPVRGKTKSVLVEPRPTTDAPPAEAPKSAPKASKAEPKPERPKAEPRPERPKAEPKGKSKVEPKESPPAESNDKPPDAPQEKSKGKKKNTPRN